MIIVVVVLLLLVVVVIVVVDVCKQLQYYEHKWCPYSTTAGLVLRLMTATDAMFTKRGKDIRCNCFSIDVRLIFFTTNFRTYVHTRVSHGLSRKCVK